MDINNVRFSNQTTSSRPRRVELFYQRNLGLKRVCWDPQAQIERRISNENDSYTTLLVFVCPSNPLSQSFLQYFIFDYLYPEKNGGKLDFFIDTFTFCEVSVILQLRLLRLLLYPFQQHMYQS